MCPYALTHIHTNEKSVYANSTSVTLRISCLYQCLHGSILYVCASEYRYQWVPEWTSHTLEPELRGSCKSPASWALNTGTGYWIQTAGAVSVVNCGSIALGSKMSGEYFTRRKWKFGIAVLEISALITWLHYSSWYEFEVKITLHDI